MPTRLHRVAGALLLAFGMIGAAPPDAPIAAGPEQGTLIAVGGGRVTPEMLQRFVTTAGGPGASVVFIPTAIEGDLEGRRWGMARVLRRAGCDVTVLHTRDRDVADSAEFTAPLKRATGVWLSGGRQWRFTDAYLGTHTLDAIRGVLDRGGVVAGSSAGATVQASYMVRGAPEGNHIMMAKGHEEGFGLLRGAAIDQHLIARDRIFDLVPVIERHPEVLGIGIDESTAIVVRGNRFEVIGLSRVGIYDHDRLAESGGQPQWLDAGAIFDLTTRRRVVRVATDAVFPPFHFVNDNGVIDGYDVAIAREALTRNGFAVDLARVTSYDDLFSGLVDGRHDLVAATTGITPDRAERYAFSTPYFDTHQAVVVLRASDVTTPAELTGRPVGASAGTTSATAAESLGARLVAHAKGTDALDPLRSGAVAAVIADEFEARRLVSEHEDLRLLATPAAAERYGLVMRREQRELVKRVNTAIAAMVEDGTVDRLRKRFGLDVRSDVP